MSNADSLKSFVPGFLLQSGIFTRLYELQGEELDTLDGAVQDIQNQCFINTATWGLALWEQFLGIETDSGKPYAHRRSVARARIRGSGTTTKEMIKNVAESFSDGLVDIIEYPPEYRFKVKFIGVRGVPPNLPDLQRTMETIKPAHLAVVYEFTYLTWAEFDSMQAAKQESMTWNQLEVYRP